MAIKYTQILNAYVSTEGSNGIMTNYIYYSMLVVHDTGLKEIVEGKYQSLKPLMLYVRTPMDEIDELKEIVRGLRGDINGIVEEKMNYIINSLYPVPDIRDMDEEEGLKRLREAGLTPVLTNSYPEGMPKTGRVKDFRRRKDRFTEVDVRIVHPMPDVEGMMQDEAMETLRNAGFAPSVVHRTVVDKQNGLVLKAERGDENSLKVVLEIASSIPDVTGKTAEEAQALLEEQGYTVKCETQYAPGPEGIVTEWSDGGNRRIRLMVSKAEQIEPRDVVTEWYDLPESTGDEFVAAAQYRDKTKEILVCLEYQIGTKAKHTVIGMESRNRNYRLSPLVSNAVMEPGGKGMIKFRVTDRDAFKELPKELEFTLETQYGLMKKKAETNMKLIFEW